MTISNVSSYKVLDNFAVTDYACSHNQVICQHFVCFGLEFPPDVML